jgi:hypothetical protein
VQKCARTVLHGGRILRAERDVIFVGARPLLRGAKEANMMTTMKLKPKLKLPRALAMTMILGGGALALAAPADEPPPPPHHRRPPEEAFTACAKLADGDTCSVTLGDHTVVGTCITVPAHIQEDAGKRVCKLPHPPREGR